MGAFREISDNIKFNFNDIARRAFSDDAIKSRIIEIIQKRLYNFGVDAKGLKLYTDNSILNEVYAPFTLRWKNFKNMPSNRVTLRETGEFYRSFKILVEQKFFEISAMFTKKDKHIFDNFTILYPSESEFEKSITSLSEDEFDRLLKNEIIYLILSEMKK